MRMRSGELGPPRHVSEATLGATTEVMVAVDLLPLVVTIEVLAVATTEVMAVAAIPALTTPAHLHTTLKVPGPPQSARGPHGVSGAIGCSTLFQTPAMRHLALCPVLGPVPAASSAVVTEAKRQLRRCRSPRRELRALGAAMVTCMLLQAPDAAMVMFVLTVLLQAPAAAMATFVLDRAAAHAMQKPTTTMMYGVLLRTVLRDGSTPRSPSVPLKVTPAAGGTCWEAGEPRTSAGTRTWMRIVTTHALRRRSRSRERRCHERR